MTVAVLPSEGRQRVVVEHVSPTVDAGAYPVRRAAGERVVVEADVFADGTAVVRAELRWREKGRRTWRSSEMGELGNDRWRGEFTTAEPGGYEFTVFGWIDDFRTWRGALEKRTAAHAVTRADLLEGAELLDQVRQGTRNRTARESLDEWRAAIVAGAESELEETAAQALRPELRALVDGVAPRERGTLAEPAVSVVVDPARARASAWYEVFPRSTSPRAGRAGTFRDLVARLPSIAAMGFDVVYLPPIHPIGRTHRKGRNNTEPAGPHDPGSPWAIGGAEGGHTAIHPALGTVADFRALVEAARKHGLEIALDLAFQCSPDHPWVQEHPEWFRRLPDGTIRTAENPPKKYEDIYPLDFETPDWRALWEALRTVVEFWVEQGVQRFRVDNPHTKPFAFWEWLLGEVRARHPEVLFLAEAFTRPKVMYRLAKVGFTHSYTYFAWRNTKAEITEYFTELAASPVRDFFRPHLWPNTPDILTEYLQVGGRAAFIGRFVLAATLSPNYGIYGPPFERLEARALVPGKEEYLDSEKYQLRFWPDEATGSLRDLITRVNRARRAEPSLVAGEPPVFHGVDNDAIVSYSRRAMDRSSATLMFVNLDPRYVQSGWTHLALEELGVAPDETFQVHDLLTDRRFLWRGTRNFVELRPWDLPVHLFRIRRRSPKPEGAESYE